MFKFMKFILIVSALVNISLGSSLQNQLHMMEESDDTELEHSPISFKHFLEKSNEVLRLRKTVTQELDYLEQAMVAGQSKEASLNMLRQLKATYAQLDTYLGVFISDQDLLTQLSIAFDIAACDEDEFPMMFEKKRSLSAQQKRSFKSAFLKRLYQKVPVIRNGRK